VQALQGLRSLVPEIPIEQVSGALISANNAAHASALLAFSIQRFPAAHLRANTMFEAGAIPPLFRTAQNVSLASTGELNLGSNSTVKSASLPGSRWTYARAQKQ